MARTVHLGENLEQLVEDQLRTGRFEDESAVLRAALELLADRSRDGTLSVEDIRLSIEESRRHGGLREADAVFDAAFAVAHSSK